MSVPEAVTGYTFRAEEVPLPLSIRYATVSHTALNFNIRKPHVNGHCPPEEESSDSCVHRLVCLPYIKLLIWSSCRNITRPERSKLLSLAAMVFQSSLLAITTRYSRIENVDGNRYLSSTAVVMSEVIKTAICLLIMAFTARKTLISQLAEITNSNDVLRCSVPALLYTVQNNLQFIAMNYLDAATFQVTYQLKILTTAMFSVCFLRRQMDVIHWSALVLLTGGVAVVQFPKSAECLNKACNNSEAQVQGVFVGLVSVLVMCISSGFAGVYTEKIIKSTNNADSMWSKNLQLALTSVLIGATAVYFYDGNAVIQDGFFQGYDAITWVVIFQQAILGLVISLVMKYADNILKGFASSIAIIVTAIVSSLVLHDLQLSWSFLVGTVLVMASALLYSMDRNVDLRSTEAVI